MEETSASDSRVYLSLGGASRGKKEAGGYSQISGGLTAAIRKGKEVLGESTGEPPERKK